MHPIQTLKLYFKTCDLATAGIQVLYILQNIKKNPPNHVLQNKYNSQPKIKMISKSKKKEF